VQLLATESSNNWNAILIIAIYTYLWTTVLVLYLWLRENCVLVLMETFAGWNSPNSSKWF